MTNLTQDIILVTSKCTKFLFHYRYISTRQEDRNRWVNMGDQSQMLNLKEYFLQSREQGELQNYEKPYLTFSYS